MTTSPVPRRILHTGQAIVDIVMQIPALPPLGGDVYATATKITAGGGFNVMAAAARDGGHVVYLGVVGDGPFARIVTDALGAERIAVPNEPIAGVDTGFSVAMVDDGAERTFVTTLGAEGRLEATHLRAVAVEAGDVVYVTGYSLLHERNRAALGQWLPTVPADAVVVFDPSPMIGAIPDDAWRLMVERATLWTLNAREARLAAERFGDGLAEGPDRLTAELAARVRGAVVLRDGSAGAWISGDEPTHVPGHPVDAVDTNGAGDAHTGVLAAALARGVSLPDAVGRANVAAAIAVTRFGPATSPTAAEIDAALGAD